jgi:hypothetical protein
MGHPDGAHTHGHGGGGLGTALLVLAGAALAVKLAGPVAAAVGELVHVLLLVVAIVAGMAGTCLAGLLAFRVRRRLDGAARAALPNPGAVSPLHGVARAAQPLPAPQPERRAIERPGESHWHVHIHGADAETIAQALRRLDDERP